jgi:hypothetical protein
LVEEILDDIKQNLEKINYHGKRADGIVKGMLQHSRSGNKRVESSLVACLDGSSTLPDSTNPLPIGTKCPQILRFTGIFVFNTFQNQY